MTFEDHPHKELLHQIDTLLKHREHLRHHTLIAKVKSHTGIKYNDQADHIAHGVVEHQIAPELTYEAADPPIGGTKSMAANPD